MELQVAALDGREPVPGLEDLDVGEPIIGKRTLTTTAKLRLGETRFIFIPTGPKRHAALVMRIKKAVGLRSKSNSYFIEIKKNPMAYV